MSSTLLVGDFVLVNALDRHPSRGDVVVFKDQRHWMSRGEEGTIIKRVIGRGGDRVVFEARTGVMTVNGVRLHEQYVQDRPGLLSFDVSVPEGELWVLGDNRENSADSRAHQSISGGFVSESSVTGVALARVWPVGRWGRVAGGD